MACTHKFFGHRSHLQGVSGLLPNWEVKTLIIGTFNPELKWHEGNKAEYYYGRTANYFWSILPCFAGLKAIAHNDVNTQLTFLQQNQIGVTDLLISIDDADSAEPSHKDRIVTVLDKEIERFHDFTWNTDPIIDFIRDHQIEAVYFTKLGDSKVVKPKENTFEFQMRKIEAACASIIPQVDTFRLHTPSGQGLGAGSPRSNVLMHRWYNSNGGAQFPFINKQFNINDFPIHYKEATDAEMIAKYF
ncbi:hypothetical protein [Pedobacter panaciterrae]